MRAAVAKRSFACTVQPLKFDHVVGSTKADSLFSSHLFHGIMQRQSLLLVKGRAAQVYSCTHNSRNCGHAVREASCTHL